MTWTKEDTEALRDTDGSCEACIGNPMVRECACLGARAADHIDLLERLLDETRNKLDAALRAHASAERRIDDRDAEIERHEIARQKDADEIESLRAQLLEATASADKHTDELIAAEARVRELEAERAEVAKELRASGSAGSTNAGWAVVTPRELLALAARLERKVDPEAALAASIPRATLVKALRERRDACVSGPWMDHDDLETRMVAADWMADLADEIERGEWPKKAGE